jgi:hypothetical protein
LCLIQSTYLPHFVNPTLMDCAFPFSLRVTHNGLSLPPLDAFYVMLGYALSNSNAIASPTTQHEYLILD